MKKRFLSLFFSFFSVLTLVYTPAVNAYTLEDATSLYNMGIDYYSQNQVQKSIEYFKKAISIDPKFYEAYYNLAQIQASYGYLDSAIKSYEKVVQLKPDDYESIYELGRLLYKRGYLNKALSYLDKIPLNEDIYTQVLTLENKIKKRQAELIAIQKQKEQQAQVQLQNKIETTTVNVSEQKPQEQTNLIVNLKAPSGVAADSQGNIYAASFSENKIYRISPDGAKSVYVESVNLGGPVGIAIDEFDNLYVANYTKNNILKVTQSGVISEFVKLRKPYCIGIDKVRKLLIVSEQDTNNVLKYEL